LLSSRKRKKINAVTKNLNWYARNKLYCTQKIFTLLSRLFRPRIFRVLLPYFVAIKPSLPVNNNPSHNIYFSLFSFMSFSRMFRSWKFSRQLRILKFGFLNAIVSLLSHFNHKSLHVAIIIQILFFWIWCFERKSTWLI
jgi:hypothetical protein